MRWAYLRGNTAFAWRLDASNAYFVETARTNSPGKAARPDRPPPRACHQSARSLDGRAFRAAGRRGWAAVRPRRGGERADCGAARAARQHEQLREGLAAAADSLGRALRRSTECGRRALAHAAAHD